MFRKWLLALAMVAALGMISTAGAVVMLNEILYDTQGDDDVNVQFTELWGTPGTDIGGYTLVGINGNGGTEYRTITIPDGSTIPADGYFVVGNTASVLNVDYVCGGAMGAGVDWQNAGSTTGPDCDGVDLRDADGATIDRICYGVCGAGHVCNGEGGTNAPDPYPAGGINKSVARIPDHQDTDNNGTDWGISDTPTSGTSNTSAACPVQYVTLSDIREQDANQVPLLDSAFVVVHGICNVANFVFDSTGLSKFFFQDDDAGCNVFRITAPANMAVGDCVTVSGWVGAYNGLTELKSTGLGNCLAQVQVGPHVNPPSPTLISGSSPMESYEGMLVRMNAVHIVSGTWPAEGQYSNNLIISDGAGTIELSISKWTNIDGTTQPVGNFDVIGIISQYDVTPPYDSYYELLPRSTADINPLSAEEPGAVSLATEFQLSTVYPNPFNSQAQISYQVGTARELTLSIYDVLGREVVHETLTGLTPGAHTYTWSPKGASGLYMLRLKGNSSIQTAKLLYMR